MYDKVRDEMKKQGMSTNKLSFRAEIAQSDLSCALNGKKPFYPAWRRRVAEALGVPEDTLFPKQ
ncbi:MAG: helix-turn-helix domain-containing protein [Clostridia bacterium]|nr:helix-turn-helix domain-containing protein [Clostridia bacterium]